MPQTRQWITGEMKNRGTGLKDWKFKEWLKGNYKTIKELIKVGTPLIASWLQTADPVWTIIATGLGKLILDVLDYYFPQV